MLRISIALLALLVAHETAVLSGQATRETFSASAHAGESTDPSTAVPIAVIIDRYTTTDEDASLRTLAKQGSSALQAALAGMADVGTIVVGGKRTALKYAYRPPRNDGKTITLLTAVPIAVFDHAGQSSPPDADSIALTNLDFSTPGFAIGDLHPSVSVTVTKDGLIAIRQDRAAVVNLTEVQQR